MSPTAEDPTDPDVARIVEVLDRHGVDYLVVGGAAARIYGAKRRTKDTDCLVRRSADNLERLAAAMRELNARLHVDGLSDEEASALPVTLDAFTLARLEISTWRTDAGDLDILADIPDREGVHRRYEDLRPAARPATVDGMAIWVAALPDVIASKEWAGRPKDREALPELYELAGRETSEEEPLN
ncbi:MAG: hypothetical protein M0014_15595 [Actinomycetota bacterium]|nr:hypothetical protein [Actinomycetota bacterium]